MSGGDAQDEDAIRPPDNGIKIYRRPPTAPDPFDELEERGDHEGALQLHDRLHPDWESGDAGALSRRARLLVPLARYDEALELLRRADETGMNSRGTPGLRQLTDIAFVYWLKGEKNAALASMREYVSKFGTRKVGYSRSSNGLHEALLYRYYAISTDAIGDVSNADAFIANQLSKAGDIWPTVLYASIVNNEPLEKALFEATGSRDIDQAVRLAKKRGRDIEHFLALRRLADVLFHDAAEHRRRGQAEAAALTFKNCAELPRCHIEDSWKLSVWEASKSAE